MSLLNLGGEVVVVRQKTLEVDVFLIQKHAGDPWSECLSVSLEDGLVNVVSDEVVPVVANQGVELR